MYMTDLRLRFRLECFLSYLVLQLLDIGLSLHPFQAESHVTSPHGFYSRGGEMHTEIFLEIQIYKMNYTSFGKFWHLE